MLDAPRRRHVLIAMLPAILLTGCGTALDRQYQQLKAQLSGEIASQQVHIERLQGAIKVVVNSELLFPSGGWQMPPRRRRRFAKMAPILASRSRSISTSTATPTTPRSGLNSRSRA